MEMQNPELNKNLPPHVSAQAHCAFCGADLDYDAQACSACGAQAEHFPPPAEPVYDGNTHAMPHADHTKSKDIPNQAQATPALEKPKIDKIKLIMAAVILILIVIIAVLKF